VGGLRDGQRREITTNHIAICEYILHVIEDVPSGDNVWNNAAYQ
jgi:hypothetical protein